MSMDRVVYQAGNSIFYVEFFSPFSDKWVGSSNRFVNFTDAMRAADIFERNGVPARVVERVV